ncbi:hypothetical protein FHW12_002788 [Dokdonella fugitiva]|jgi:hypothetical protein|uniref:Uncharacterized protein n=1 Tax=Dokdonella fugitiva TaxID=328517 RepID=A0A839EXR5_9GAMM|nr:hypothetical protein [Dokdonella fugitiva]MBA8888555.1 hypothetical protein [Dokdonella fugitiva]
MKAMATLLYAGMLACCAATIHAKESSYHQNVNANSADTFQQLVTWVHDEMKTGGRYASLTPTDRTVVDMKFAQMQDLFDKNGSLDRMRAEDKVELYNTQEEINALLATHDSAIAERGSAETAGAMPAAARIGRENDRVICERRTKLGSHIMETYCHTYAQAKDARRDTQRQMDTWAHSQCAGSTPERGEGGCGLPHMRTAAQMLNAGGR